jgi:hypothetical protein
MRCLSGRWDFPKVDRKAVPVGISAWCGDLKEIQITCFGCYQCYSSLQIKKILGKRKLWIQLICIYIYINTLSNEFPVGAKGSFTSSGSKISRFFASAKISWEDVMMGSWKSKNLPIATQQPPKKIEKWHEKTKITRGLVNFPDFWWSTVLSLGDFTWFHCKHQGLFAIVLQRFCNLTDLTIELQGTLSKSMNSCPDADGQHDPTLQLQFPKIAGKNLHTL